ncbi:hypothetical protein BJ912DRAFT_1023820 [Pholiota molesta]|nr:hypothetical protein BJ912DRAFT_1023820 [Pholiota molesta]
MSKIFESEDDAGKKKKTAKRRKVNHACLYCRRSHMTCDEGRPCQRCIKREIGHLCHDERRPKLQRRLHLHLLLAKVAPPQQSSSTWPMAMPSYMTYQPESFGSEFSVLTDFLETLDDGSFFTPPTTVAPSLVSSASFATTSTAVSTNPSTATTTFATGQMQATIYSTAATAVNSTPVNPPAAPQKRTETILPAATKTERFLLTAADQESGSRDERLNQVIRSKYEAGLLKPYNYVKGYARLSRWMDRNVSQESKQQILQPLSVLRPKFRAVAQSLRDIDLVFIEEAFERMLLDYDRVFSAMGVPANREFTELVGVDGYMMRDGRLCIYELMAEESAVNYWEKYGHVAFDSSQKAVLTSCVLRYKPVLNSSAASPSSVKPHQLVQGTPGASTSSAVLRREEEHEPMEEGFINCCFSFTIRRDKWGIPSMIVGNFIQC